MGISFENLERQSEWMSKWELNIQPPYEQIASSMIQVVGVMCSHCKWTEWHEGDNEPTIKDLYELAYNHECKE